MAKYDVGPCSCGHTFAGIEANSEEEAVEAAIDLSPEHIEQFHQDDPEYNKLKAMSREELTAMLRPLVHLAEEREPAFRETLETDEEL